MSINKKRKALLAAATAIGAVLSLAVPATAQAETRTVTLQGGGLRYLDAHEIQQLDFQVVTRPLQDFDATQQWRMTDLGGGVNTIQQVSSGQYLDIREDYLVVTRPRQDDDTQRWRVQDFGGDFVMIQNVSSGGFLEPLPSGPDFLVVTRPQGGDQQTWRIG